MLNLRIEINTCNASCATAEDATAEAARQLCHLADEIEAGQPEGHEIYHPLFDANGNTIGGAFVTVETDEEG